MKNQFFKIVGSGRSSIVEEIVETFPGGAVGYKCGQIEPTIYKSGDEISNVVEISRQEFDRLLIMWVDNKGVLIDKAALKLMKDSIKESKFEPITKFLAIFDDIQVEGFSQRTPEQLNQFIQDNSSRGILMLNQEGDPRALLSADDVQRASFIYSKIK